MFYEMSLFTEHLKDNGPHKYKLRMDSEGVPNLYVRL